MTLDREFLDQKADGHQLVFHTRVQDFGGLAEHARNLVQTSDVILVVLDRVEWNRKRQVGKAGMNAVLLVDGHLVLFEIKVGDALLEDADQEIVRESVLVGEARSRDGLKPRQECLVGLVALEDRVQGILGKPVVVTIVAKGGSPLREVAEIGLVLLFEKGVLGGKAFGNLHGILAKGKTGRRNDKKQAVERAHRYMQGTRAKGG